MGKTRKRNYVFLSIMFVALLCLAAIPAVSAFTATLISPSSASTTLHAGDTISIQISGLTAGDSFQYRLSSTDLATPGNTVTLNNVNMPFAFSSGTSSTTLSTTGLTSAGATLTVRRLSDSSEQVLTGNPISTAKNIAKDNYYISVSGEKTGSTIGIDYSVSGTVSDAGTNPSTLSLTLSNVNTGHLTVQVLDGSTTRLSQTFTIDVAAPTPVPDPDDGGGGGGGGGDSGAPAAAPAAPAAPTGPTTTATLQQNEQGQVLADYVIEGNPSAGFSTTVGISAGTAVVSPTGQPVNQVSITPLDAGSVPDLGAVEGTVYSFSGLSVECGPSGTQFVGGSATISFSLTPDQWADAIAQVNGNTAAMTISFYDATTQAWVEVPTTVDPVTHTVTAQVTHFSMYALFYKATTEEEPQTFGELAGTSPTMAGAIATAAPPSAASPVVNDMAAPAPTESPGLSGIAAIAVVALVGYGVMRKKR